MSRHILYEGFPSRFLRLSSRSRPFPRACLLSFPAAGQLSCGRVLPVGGLSLRRCPEFRSLAVSGAEPGALGRQPRETLADQQEQSVAPAPVAARRPPLLPGLRGAQEGKRGAGWSGGAPAARSRPSRDSGPHAAAGEPRPGPRRPRGTHRWGRAARPARGAPRGRRCGARSRTGAGVRGPCLPAARALSAVAEGARSRKCRAARALPQLRTQHRPCSRRHESSSGKSQVGCGFLAVFRV